MARNAKAYVSHIKPRARVQSLNTYHLKYSTTALFTSNFVIGGSLAGTTSMTYPFYFLLVLQHP